MKQFDYTEKWKKLLTPEIVSYLTTIHEYKGKQYLIAERHADVLENLVEMAKIQSTESSNKIEGIYTSEERLKKIVLDKTMPRTRNEREIAGYRDVLNTIHENFQHIPIRDTFILQLHRDLYKFENASNGGRFKTSDNIIEEEDEKGNKFVRFRPLPAWEAAERREQVHLNRNKRHAWRKKHRRGIAITILILTIAVFFAIEYYEVQKLIPIGCSSENLEGLKYTEVVQKLKEAGFSNVQTKEISDLTISRDAEEKLVTDIKLIFGDSFDENTKYPSNLGITVVYHTVELYNPPLTSKKAKGMNYIDVIREFENVGFTNVTTNVEYDIVTGWLTDDGEVKSVTINGKKEFDSDDKYRLDAEVVVTYHTLKKNKPK